MIFGRRKRRYSEDELDERIADLQMERETLEMRTSITSMKIDKAEEFLWEFEERGLTNTEDYRKLKALKECLEEELKEDLERLREIDDELEELNYEYYSY